MKKKKKDLYLKNKLPHHLGTWLISFTGHSFLMVLLLLQLKMFPHPCTASFNKCTVPMTSHLCLCYSLSGTPPHLGFPGGQLSSKESACSVGNAGDMGFILRSGRSPLEKSMATHSSVLAWRIPRTRSLAGCSPKGRTESDTTEAI